MKTEINSEIAIIGSGPSGLRALSTAIKNNLMPVIFDWDRYPGGILRLLGRDINYPTEAKLFTNTTVVDIVYNPRGNHKLVALKKGEVINVNTKRIVIAIGSRDITAAGIRISGDRPSGVFTATQALRLLSEGYIPGRKVVILGGNELSITLSKILLSKNVEVTLVTPKRKIQNISGIQLIQGYTITHVEGKGRVEKVKLAISNEDFMPIKDDKEYYCDTLVISAGFRPLMNLLNKLPIMIDPLTKGPVVNEALEALNGINIIGGALAPFESLKNVEKTGDLILKKSKEVNGKIIHVKPGSNIKFLIPQKVLKGETFTLFYSIRPDFKKLRIVEYNLEMPINEEEGFIEINTAQFRESDTITIEAVK